MNNNTNPNNNPQNQILNNPNTMNPNIQGINNQNNTLNIEDEKLKSQLFKEHTNQFINNESIHNETSLTDLNVDGTYNKLENNTYPNNIQVSENINNQKNKKATIKITKEMKTFIIIVIIMLIFIFIMPTVFDFIQNIKYN